MKIENKTTAALIAELMYAQRRQVAAEVADFIYDTFKAKEKAGGPLNVGDIYEAIADHFKCHDMLEDIDFTIA